MDGGINHRKLNVDVLTEVCQTVGDLFPQSKGKRKEFEVLVKSLTQIFEKTINSTNGEKFAPAASCQKNVLREIIKGMLCSGLHTTHDICFSHGRMNSVKRKHDSNLPSAIFFPPDSHGLGFDPESDVPPDERHREKTSICQHKTRAHALPQFQLP